MSVHLNLWRRLTVVTVALMALAGLAVASGQQASATPFSCDPNCIRITNNGGSGGGSVTVMDRWCGVNHGSRPCSAAIYQTITPGQTVTTDRAFAIAGGCSGYVTWYVFNEDDGRWVILNSYPIDRHGTDALWTQVTYEYWARVSQTCG